MNANSSTRSTGNLPVPMEAETLADAVLRFARTLRAAGIAVGPASIIDALGAVEAVGIERRDDVFAALESVLIHRAEDRLLFREAFDACFRGVITPSQAERELLAAARPAPTPPPPTRSQRLRDALASSERSSPGDVREHHEIEGTLSWSEQETLRQKDFAQMSTAEIAAARHAIARMTLLFAKVKTRRLQPHHRGRFVDLRATLRRAARSSEGMVALCRRRNRRVIPPLVLLCDISGSMERYARLLLHFFHAVSQARPRVHAFAFGTRLTSLTRHLRSRDVDVALRSAARTVCDWSGGTRIGTCVREFNFHWSRRVLAQGATVILITDGLDRGETELLEREMARLRRSSRTVIWLNPLLGYAAFAPRAAGIRVMRPHVDRFLPVHNLASLEELAEVLARG